MIGETITHVKFGEGIVSEKTDKLITVIFQEGTKKFQFPDAFEKYLVLKSTKKQKQVDKLVDVLVEERKKEEDVRLKEKKYYERIWNLKIKPNSQVAFGFVKNTREEVFSSWTLSTGRYLSGKSQGKPRIPKRMNLNSACLLTVCPEGRPEKERKIIGAFMVKDDFEGELCRDGQIHSHEEYRIQLESSEELLFWEYFAEDVEEYKWGNTEIRYFSNQTMGKILEDMQKNAASLKQKQNIEKFYRYFLWVNKLIQEEKTEIEG